MGVGALAGAWRVVSGQVEFADTGETADTLGPNPSGWIIFTEGVVRRGMTLERFADVTATNAARILGLYPQKGVISPGSDADLVLIDPSISKTLSREDFHVR